MAADRKDEGAISLESFPKNRFSLELVDVLLDSPCVFPLDQPVVTVGLLSGHDWNLPLESLLGRELFEVFESLWKCQPWWSAEPLLTLTFNAQKCTWNECGRAMPHTKWTHESVVEPGKKFDVALCVEGPGLRDMEDFGLITMVLHDATQQQQPASIFIQKLASLPEVPLAVIASYLNPLECVHDFCSLDSSIPQKLQAVGVQWQKLVFAEETAVYAWPVNASSECCTLLDCLRILKLVADGDAFKALHLGGGFLDDGWTNVWRMMGAGYTKLGFKQLKKLILAPKLEDLSLSACWLPAVIDSAKPLPASLRTLLIVHHGCHEEYEDYNCRDFWMQIARLTLPPATVVQVSLRIPYLDYSPVDVGALEEDEIHLHYDSKLSLPNVISIRLDNCGHSPILPPRGLLNLQKLEWCVECPVGEGDEGTRYRRVIDSLQASCFPKLEMAILTVGQSVMSIILEGLATAAPGLQVLTLKVRDDSTNEGRRNPGYQSLMPHLQEITEPLLRFPKLRHLKIDSMDQLVQGLASTLQLCLALPRSIPVIELSRVNCYDLCRNTSSEQSLRSAGKEIILTRPSERITSPFGFVERGCSEYKVVFCDKGFDDRTL